MNVMGWMNSTDLICSEAVGGFASGAGRKRPVKNEQGAATNGRKKDIH